MRKLLLGSIASLLFLVLLANPLSLNASARQVRDDGNSVHYMPVAAGLGMSGWTGSQDSPSVSVCIFCDDFNDNDFNTPAGPWIPKKGVWSAASADAVGSTRSKGDLVSPDFSCTTCTFEAHISVQAGGRVSLFGWYTDGGHSVEIQLMQDKQKLFIKQNSGAASIKATTPFPIAANTPYDVQASFDGTNFQVTVNGAPVPALTIAAVGSPSGKAVFRVKSPAGRPMSGTLSDISVTQGEVGAGGRCTANRDCGVSLFCAPSGVCSPAGSGVLDSPCASGAECDKDLVCNFYGLGGTCAAAGAGEPRASCTAITDCIAGLACNGVCVRAADAFPPFAGVACAADTSPFKVFFHVPRPGIPLPDFFRLPFPNDARVNVDGTLDLSDFPRPGPSVIGVDIVDLYADALSQDFDGFSSVASVTFRFSKEIDFNTVSPNLRFIDVTDPTDAVTFGSEHSIVFSYIGNRGLYECQHTLQVAPKTADPLLPGHVYAVYLSSNIRSTDDKKPVLDSDLALVLGGSLPANVTLQRVWTQYAGFRTFLAQNGLTSANVAGVTVFTVQDTTGKMIALAHAAQLLPQPALSSLTLCDGVNTSPCEIPGDAGRVCGSTNPDFFEIHGKISIPNYQQGTLPYEFPADGGEILYDNTGVPTQNGATDVCFALTVPKSSMPAGGWPLVVHAHGTGGSFKSAITSGIADDLATAGTPMATLTYEGIGSGARRGASTRNSDGLVFNIVNPRAARDNHLQGAVDVIQTLRVAQAAPFVVDTVNIAFDSSKTYFFGHSQGSNVGIPGIATSSLAKGAVFSGAGSYLSERLLTKTSPFNAGEVLASHLGELLTNGHPVMTILQTFFDRMDSVNFDPLILAMPPNGVASKNVLLTWGQGDTFSPESTLNITAQAMQLDLGEPVVTPIFGLQTVSRPVSGNTTGGDSQIRTAVCTQYQTGGLYDGHFVAFSNTGAEADWLSFLTSAANSGTPTIP